MGQRQRRKAREQARDEVAFGFGFFAVALPVVALVAGAIGIAIGRAALPQALITVALMVLMLVSMNNERWTVGEKQRWTAGKLVYLAIVNCTAEVVARLAPVPVVGDVAAVLGTFVALWLPIVVLVAVGLVT